MFKLNPYRAVSFKESSIKSCISDVGYVIAQTKYDGVRALLVLEYDSEYFTTGTWMSRADKTIPALEHLNGSRIGFDHILTDEGFPHRYESVVIDGELMVSGVDFNTSSGILRSKYINEVNYKYHRGTVERKADGKIVSKQRFNVDPKVLTYVPFAMIPWSTIAGEGDYDIPQVMMGMRIEASATLLEMFLGMTIVLPTETEIYDYEDLQDLYESTVDKGSEGLIIKDPLGNYKRGKKSGWWKMKAENTIDGEIIGYVYGTEGKANEGLVIGFEVLLENGIVVSACGITKEQMQEFTLNHSYIGYSVEVKYMEQTPDGSLRHPTFLKFRGVEEDEGVKI